MSIATPSYSLQQQTPSTKISLAGSRLGWRQRLHLWRAARQCARLQRLEDLWDAQHEQVWVRTAGSHWDLLITWTYKHSYFTI